MAALKQVSHGENIFHYAMLHRCDQTYFKNYKINCKKAAHFMLFFISDRRDILILYSCKKRWSFGHPSYFFSALKNEYLLNVLTYYLDFGVTILYHLLKSSCRSIPIKLYKLCVTPTTFISSYDLWFKLYMLQTNTQKASKSENVLNEIKPFIFIQS